MKITKSELREIIQEVADEMGLFEGLTKAQEKLPEPLKKAILKKQGKSDDSEEKEDVEEGLTKAQEKLPEPLKKAILKKQGKSDDSEEKEDVEESIEEGNAFGAAVQAARENGDSEFVVGGKTYQLKEKVAEEVEDTEEFVGDLEEQSSSSELGKGGEEHVNVADSDDEELPAGTEVQSAQVGEEDDEMPKVADIDEDVQEASCGTHEEDEDDVEEGNAFGAAVQKAKEDGEKEFEVDGKTYKVRENWSKISLSEKLDRILGNRKVL